MSVHPRASRLLVLRSTEATRSLVRGAPHVFAAAYPGSTAEAVEALRTATGVLPMATIVWIDLRGTASRLLDGPPRGIDSGR
jgi:hypothetical protein